MTESVGGEPESAQDLAPGRGDSLVAALADALVDTAQERAVRGRSGLYDVTVF